MGRDCQEVNKALQQKLDATDRTHLTCELKKGNLVLTFSTAPLNNSELFSEIVPIIGIRHQILFIPNFIKFIKSYLKISEKIYIYIGSGCGRVV
jgi:hypothetical protein